MEALQRYLESHFGIRSIPRPVGLDLLTTLPLGLQSNHRFYEGSLWSHAVVWAQVKDPVEVSPLKLKKQKALLQAHFGRQIIFVFSEMDPYLRRALTTSQIAFAQPNRHLFVPEILLESDESPRALPKPIVDTVLLSAPAQYALIYHLLVAKLDRFSLQKAAETIAYSPMTMSRIAREFEGCGIAQRISAKEKRISFALENFDLWQAALPFLQSPVRETWYCDEFLADSYTRIAGESALAAVSMIADPSYKCFAIGKERVVALKRSNKLPPIHPRLGAFKIEVWHYDPCPLTTTNTVDPLSLYLSLQAMEDDRIEMETASLFNGLKWSQD